MGNQTSAQIAPLRTYNVMSSTNTPKKFALIIIDVQNDFCKGGALEVKEADHTVAPINKLRYMYDQHIKTVVSQDWHNPDHMSFAATHNVAEFSTQELHLEMEDGTFTDVKQKVWPIHCVKNTVGSCLHSDLIVTQTDKIIRKGTKTNVESYSVFGDELKGKYEKTDFYDWLQRNDITDIILTGVATDYCVYYTALDAIRLGFTVHLIMSCTRGVAEDTTEKALADMATKGVLFYPNVESFNTKQQDKIINNWIMNQL